MTDYNEIVDLVDVIYEYNTEPTIRDVSEELGISYVKASNMVDCLVEYGIVSVTDDEILPLVSYEGAIIMLNNLN